MPAPERVAAFVLARDRTTELQEVLDALESQTRRPDETLIVSNAGTAEVDALIERACAREGVSSLRLEHNAGGAGGFSAGIAELMRSAAADFIWVFDDDAIPALDCLERLLEEASTGMRSRSFSGQPRPMPPASSPGRSS